MSNNQRACEFEALVCETNAIGCEMEGMKAINTQREQNGETLAYDERAFLYVREQYEEMAAKFRALGAK